MKNVLQAAALIVMTTVVTVAAAKSCHNAYMECRNEWELTNKAVTQHAEGDILITQNNFLKHLQ
ncbi:MAG TPA: hypothetical protein PKC39_00110 [Ferruginibacter sp.]|nr:hypothetical protein [Ferruginibacter sp.]HMP19332.1 hypothetical protein [Ferruginibacter sp.]